MIGGLKNAPDLRWASPLELKNAVEKTFVDTFGSKEEALAKLKAEKAKVDNGLLTHRALTLIIIAGCEETYAEAIHF